MEAIHTEDVLALKSVRRREWNHSGEQRKVFKVELHLTWAPHFLGIEIGIEKHVYTNIRSYLFF